MRSGPTDGVPAAGILHPLSHSRKAQGKQDIVI